MQILMLEKRLQDQVSVRCALERALGYRASSHDITTEATIPKVAVLFLTKLSLSALNVFYFGQLSVLRGMDDF